jgi:hypothetical protein
MTSPLRPPLEDDLTSHDHEPDDPVPHVREAGDAVLEPIVRQDRRAELARERQDEVVGVRARGRLLNLTGFDERLVAVRIVDLMPQGGVGDEDRRHPVLREVVAHESDIR